jgi:signal transduction histidine kinase
MAHPHERDLDPAHAVTGRGYAHRVSPALARLRSPSPALIDAGVALLIGVPTMIAALVAGSRHDKLWAGVVFGLLASVPLFFRTRWPFPVLAVIVTGAVLAPIDVGWQLPLMAVLYTIGAHRSREAALTAVAAVTGVAVAYALAAETDFTLGAALGTAILCSLAAGTGLYIGGKRTSIDVLRERAERLDRERELLAEAAVAAERVRIAQELHDVVAHNVSLLVVQAQALGATAGDERVRRATDDLAELGRQTMAEMHRTLKLLRAPGDDGAQLAPQPGLADLDALLDRSRSAGVRVELAVEGAPRALPQGVDLSAFRIVQEALTNVVKHAGRAKARVQLTYGPEALELTIVDSGGDGARPRSPRAPAGGHGLIGMRERTALFGGTLTAGPCDGDGFEVHASLPYGGSPA